MLPPRIMGVVNVTPDSFSDGGLHAATDSAIHHAVRLVDDGADVVDVGGESTRPGAEPVSVQQEMDRVLPVIEGICAQRPGTIVSIDTTKAAVAEAAVHAGARMINDVAAGRGEGDMFAIAARCSVPYILMHMQGEPRTMQDNPQYADVVEDVAVFLAERAALARTAGVRDVLVDIGIGFGKTLEHNVALLRRLDRFNELGFPQVLGISRKRFLGTLTGVADASQRDAATMLAHAMLLHVPVHMIRVHNVALARQMYALTVLNRQLDEGGR